MRRLTLALVMMLSLSGSAWAGPPKAMVKGVSYNWLDTEAVPCGVVIETQLRERGFEIIERTLPEGKAGLVVYMTAACAGIWHPGHFRIRGHSPDSHCSAHARVHGPAVRNFTVKGQGDSNTGHIHALSGACRQVAERMDRQLGGSGNIDINKRRQRASASKSRFTVVLRWKGELKPMPLLTATKFFQRAGYESKLKKGGAQRCSFQVSIEDDRERFIHLLKTYLESKYAVRLAKNRGAELVFALSKRTE